MKVSKVQMFCKESKNKHRNFERDELEGGGGVKRKKKSSVGGV